MSDLELVKSEAQPVAVAPAAPNIGAMLQAVIDKGIDEKNVKALEQLVSLYERCQDRDAERAFAAAFVALQSEMPKIEATRAVPNNDGTVRYHFAPYEEIMRAVAPLLQKHGFTLTFSTDFKEGRLIKTCVLQHISGHSKSNSFAVRIGKGPPGSSETQGDGAASTYAKRFALCDCLNISIERDTDADPRAEGALISPELANELERRIVESNSNKAKFLKLAGAASFAEMSASKYEVLDQLLREKEQRGR